MARTSTGAGSKVSRQSASATRSRSGRSGCVSSARAGEALRMTAPTAPGQATPRPSAPALPRVFGPIRPRPRWLELRLLAFVAIALVAGSVSLSATLNGSFRLYDPKSLVIYIAALLGAHAAQVLAGRRPDQILLPA